jgi:hypothetical protein
MEQAHIITPRQSRMARAALDLSLPKLNKVSGLGINTVSRFEGGAGMLATTMEKLSRFYQEQGLEFPDTRTVRLAKKLDEDMAA